MTTIEARMSRPPISSNTSGYNGVYCNKSGKWVAQITFKGKTYYLGSFDDIQDAVKAGKEGKKCMKISLSGIIRSSTINEKSSDCSSGQTVFSLAEYAP